MKIEILEFKEHHKNTLQGFVDLLIIDTGLEIRGCTLHEKTDSKWIGLPGRAFEKNGEQCWANILNFPDPEHRRQFQDAALIALREYRGSHPAGQAQADIPF